jgi:transcriptional regulator with XRE-family HTH domain
MSKPLHNEDYRAFLILLRAMREAQGVSQAQLAALLEQDQTFVSKCETGIRRLDVIELRLWVTALGFNLMEFTEVLEERLDSRLRQTKPRSRRR